MITTYRLLLCASSCVLSSGSTVVGRDCGLRRSRRVSPFQGFRFFWRLAPGLTPQAMDVAASGFAFSYAVTGRGFSADGGR